MKKRGFTTVEILAGTVLISVGMLSVYLSLAAASSLERKAKFVKIATFEAQRSLESARNKKFSYLTTDVQTTSLTTLPYGQKIVTIASVETNLMKITSTVTWQSGGIGHAITLETLAAVNGINDNSK